MDLRPLHGNNECLDEASTMAPTNPRASWHGMIRSPHRIAWLAVATFSIGATVFGGCGHKNAEKKTEAGAPVVRVVKPELRTIDLKVEQPGYVYAFEQTSLFAKVSGFISAYYVDIGDEVKKDQVLADISVPELVAKHDQMVNQVAYDNQLVAQSKELVNVAEKSLQNAEAEKAEAVANLGKYEADIVRWQSEVQRLTEMVREKVVDKDILTETQRQLDSSIAAKKAADAAVAARDAERQMAAANLAKAKIDVDTAKAKVKVSEAEERDAKALLDYTHVHAPYDGVVTHRNANTGDYVQAVSGDKSTTKPSAIFVVQRTDKLRIFCNIDEGHAAYVQPGTKAAVQAAVLNGAEIQATVTRTSWAVREQTRSLWTEIDLTKKEYGGLRAGMYVNVAVFIHRPNVYVLPEQAIKEEGNQKYCYLDQDGKAVKTPVEVDTGLNQGQWVVIDKMRIDDPWVKVNGHEQVIVGDLGDLTDGQAVRAEPAEAHSELAKK